MKLKKNDTVKVIAGKDKGKTGRIVQVYPERERVVVQGVNMVKKTMKKKNPQDKGGIMEIEAPIHVSNVAYVTGNGDATRIGYKFDESGKKVRYAKKTGEVI
jgi:large subunit ribosomal protein L24